MRSRRFNSDLPDSTNALLAAMAVAHLVVFWLLHRSRDDGLAILRTVLALALVTILWVSTKGPAV